MMNKLLIIMYALAISIMNLSHVYAMNTSCVKGSERQLRRSSELDKLAKEDQKDRENWQQLTNNESIEIAKRDLARRKKVGEIFAEGCFKNANDYMSAALIYQHGDTPDHYYQAYIWSKFASELGDAQGKPFSSLAIDRYLVSMGKKQLFGTQFHKTGSSQCYCMQPVEESFPDEYRKQYLGRSLKDNYKMMASINKANCPNQECRVHLDSTPKGSVIGLW